LAKTATGSSKDVLKVEKRLVEIELEFKEIKESIENIDLSAVPEMKEKIDSIESMITVEQAAILELKKLLESSEKPAIPEDLEQRLATIETNVQNAVNKADFETKIDDIKKDLIPQTPETQVTPVEIENIYNKITQLESNVGGLKAESETLTKEVEEKLSEISMKAVDTKQSTIDYDLLTSKIEAGKESIDELSRSKMDLELKIAEVMKKMEIIHKEFGRSPEQKLIDSIKVNRKEIIGVSARIDSLERVTRELMGDAQNLERTVKKFESLEKLSLLSKDIEEKLEKTKFVEDEVKRLTSKIQLIYDEMDNRLEKLRAMEREYTKNFAELEDNITMNKKQIQKMKKEQAENFVKVLQEARNLIGQRAVEIEKDIKHLNSSQIGEMRAQIDTITSTMGDIQKVKLDVVDERERISELSKEILTNKEGIEKLHKEINDKISAVEAIEPMLENKIMDIRKSLYPMVNEGIKPIHKRSAELENRINQVSSGYRKFIEESSRRFYAIENMKNVLDKKMDDVKKSVQPIVRGELKEFDKRAGEMERRFRDIKTDQINRILTDVTTRLSLIENKFSTVEKISDRKLDEFRSAVREKLAEMKAGAGMDEHLNEVVNRIIFLESRIRGIENSIEKMARERDSTQNMVPIIIE